MTYSPEQIAAAFAAMLEVGYFGLAPDEQAIIDSQE